MKKLIASPSLEDGSKLKIEKVIKDEINSNIFIITNKNN